MNKYIKNNWKPLVLSMFFAALGSICAITVQFLKGDVLDLALQRNSNDTLKYGVCLFVFIIFEIGLMYLHDLSRGKFTVNCVVEVRSAFFNNLLSRSYPKYLQQKQGDYIAEYTNQLEIIETSYFGTIPLLIEILIKIILVSISLFMLDYRIAIITMVLLTTPLYVPKIVEARLQKAQKANVEQFEKHLGLILDWLNGFEVIKNYSIEAVIRKRFEASNKELRNKNLKMRQMGYLTRGVSALLSYVSHFVILIFAAYLVLKGEFTAGSFFVAVGMIDQLSYPIISLSQFIQDIITVKPVNNAMEKFINYKDRETGKVSMKSSEPISLLFNDVSFSYKDGSSVFNHLNIIIDDKKRYLLQGKSGSGKTTCMNLAMGYFEPDFGDIKINGHSIEEIKNLYELITVMRQDAVLFEDSLWNNITLYQNASIHQVFEVLIKVGLQTFATEDCLNMIIHEGGTNLSGGEKRRIALARSLLRQSPILVLDEPLANLDDENVKLIEDELLGIKDRTIVIISHQFSENKLSKFDKVYNF